MKKLQVSDSWTNQVKTIKYILHHMCGIFIVTQKTSVWVKDEYFNWALRAGIYLIFIISRQTQISVIGQSAYVG